MENSSNPFMWSKNMGDPDFYEPLGIDNFPIPFEASILHFNG
jgi:hypothetical protein